MRFLASLHGEGGIGSKSNGGPGKGGGEGEKFLAGIQGTMRRSQLRR